MYRGPSTRRNYYYYTRNNYHALRNNYYFTWNNYYFTWNNYYFTWNNHHFTRASKRAADRRTTARASTLRRVRSQ